MNDAGEFSTWLNDFTQTMRGLGRGSVPCGQCVACCTSAKFIHIKPTDHDSLQVIRREIMFPAPGLPKGHYLLGYSKNGCCPMFQKGKCSIYDYRPETCRQYDCRVLAATGVSTNLESPEISKQASSWEFSYTTQESVAAQQAVKEAMRFLADNATKFPPGYLPASESQLAAVAIRIHGEFIGLGRESLGANVMAQVKRITSKYRVG